MLWKAGVTSLLAVGVCAGGVADLVAEGLLTGRSPGSLEQRMADDAMRLVVVETRASATDQGNQNSTAESEAWNTQVNNACIDALSKLTKATNPSGTCTCYNLPAMNNETGAFEADLRLYQISTPNGDFQGISPDQVQVSLSYNGASVSPMSTSTNTNTNTNTNKAAQKEKRGNSNPKLLQKYLFVGQIDQTKLQDMTNMAAVEAVVMPTVTLSAANAGGQTVSTNVSSNEASFLVGALSDIVVLSDDAKAQIAVDQVVQGLNNGTVAFVLPGVNLLIFPVGLVVTGAWVAIGMLVIGMGFFERVQHREAYRKSSAIAVKGSVNTF